ncbi:MAG: hypothetical protein K8F36_06390 [Melioribacteraceae bacterium]|nr:hypothetical protein [Melioribacteraceae bacterium]
MTVKSKKQIFLFVSAIIISACSTLNPVNDLFGIEMPEEEYPNFKIGAYTEETGISYYSNNKMNTDLFAWAEVESKNLRIMIYNSTNNELKLNRNEDQYLLRLTDRSEIFLTLDPIKFHRYPSSIKPGTSAEVFLLLPQKYWTNVEKVIPGNRDEENLRQYDEKSPLNFDKTNISYVKILLNTGKTIFLKSIPQSNRI